MTVRSGPTAAQLQRFRTLVATTLGMRFDDDKLPLLSRTLTQRASVKRLVSLDQYLDRLVADSQEVRSVASELSVNESYFLRDPRQFKVFEAVLRERQRQGHRQLRVLSAACASGEEAYSLAMVAHQTLGSRSDLELMINAIDVDPRMLRLADRARYSEWSMRALPDDLRQRYFRRDKKHYVLDPDVRSLVTFECRNLLDADPDFWAAERFDVIFCRNVLMYFTSEALQRALSTLSHSLMPSGCLFLGHAENLRGRGTPLELCHSHGAFYYRSRLAVRPDQDDAHGCLPGLAGVQACPSARADAKPTAHGVQSRRRDGGSQNTRPPSETRSWTAAVSDSAGRVASLSSKRSAPGQRGDTSGPTGSAARLDVDALSGAHELLRHERFKEAFAALPAGSEPTVDLLLLRLILQMGMGRLAAAESDCEAVLRLDPLNADAHHAKALCLEHREDTCSAMEEYRNAVYLDRNFAMPHLRIGVLARRAGEATLARRELTLALDMLREEHPTRLVLFGGGFDRAALQSLCKAELKACGGAK